MLHACPLHWSARRICMRGVARQCRYSQKRTWVRIMCHKALGGPSGPGRRDLGSLVPPSHVLLVMDVCVAANLGAALCRQLHSVPRGTARAAKMAWAWGSWLPSARVVVIIGFCMLAPQPARVRCSQPVSQPMCVGCRQDGLGPAELVPLCPPSHLRLPEACEVCCVH